MPQSKKLDLATIIGQPQDRAVAVTQRELKIDEEKRTIDLAFSSEFPVLRWYGYEILDHSNGAGNIERLNDGGPFLLCHDKNQQVGAVVPGTAKIGKDKVGRATVKMSQSAHATEIFQDIKDEIRRTISFGYIPFEMILEKDELDGLPTYRVTKWEAVEISLEPIPGDTSVGVGRTLDTPQTTAPGAPTPTTEERHIMDPIEATPNTPAATAPPPTAPVVNESILRAREIRELGELFNEPDLAIQFGIEDKTPAEFRAACLAKRVAATPTTTEDATSIAARSGGRVQVIARNGKLKYFRGEGADKRAYRFGQWAIAALLQRNADLPIVQRAKEYCQANGLVITRAATESVNEDGGYTVPTEFGNDIIDLREEFGVLRANMKVVPMASDSKTEPRREGGLTMYAVGETKAITESKKKWGQVLLVAKMWGVLSKTSIALSEDSIVPWGDDMLGEIAFAFSQGEDNVGFNADGSSTYHGITGIRDKILNLSATRADIASLVVAAGNLFSEWTLQNFLDAQGLLPSYADKRAEPKWFCHKRVWTSTMKRVALGAGGVTAQEIEAGNVTGKPTFLGAPVEISQVLPSQDGNDQISVLYGAPMLAGMLGDRTGISIAMSDSDGDDFASAILSVRGLTRFDINWHDVGNASATPTLRVPGPMIAIASAAA